MKGRSQRLRPVLDPPAHLRPLLGLGHTRAAHVAPQPADLSRKASTAVWMRMEWGKCRADTRSSHREHVHRIALDTERKGRVPWPIRPPADPRLDPQPARPRAGQKIVRILHACTGHHVEGDSQSAAPRPPCALEPTTGGGGASGRPGTPRLAPTCTHEGRRVPGAGRQWGQKSAPGIVHLRRAEQARDSAEEQSRRPAGPGWRAPRAADTVHRPPARLSPRSRPAAPPTSELQAPRQPPARWREGPERQ